MLENYKMVLGRVLKRVLEGYGRAETRNYIFRKGETKWNPKLFLLAQNAGIECYKCTTTAFPELPDIFVQTQINADG